MSWTVEFTASAKREFRQLDDGPRRAASDLIQDLIEDPALELRGYPETWRARFHHDRYRMIYQLAKSRRRIIVKHIRLRAIAYEGLKG